MASSLPSLGKSTPKSSAASPFPLTLLGRVFSTPPLTSNQLKSRKSLTGFEVGAVWLCLRGEPSLVGEGRKPDFEMNGDKVKGLSLGGASVRALLFDVPVTSARISVLVAARASDGRLVTRFSGEPRAIMSSSGASMKISKATL